MKLIKSTKIALLAAAVALPTGFSAVEAMAEEVTIKLWSRADRSGPMRAGNIVGAAQTLNNMLAAAGSDIKVTVEVHENNAKGFDADALDVMKAFAADKGPDIYVAAHEWIGAFVEAGYAMNMEQHIAANPDFYSDMIPVLWESVTYKGQRYGIPQDSEIRMFFYNKEMLRKIGKSEDFIEGLPAAVEEGQFTLYDLADLAAEVVDKGAAKYGFVHRPNVGPDFQMLMASFGIELSDPASGKLKMDEAKLANFFTWLKYAVDKGALPENMTSWSWDSVHQAFRGRESFMKFHGIWNVPHQLKIMNLTEENYFNELGWLHSPAEKQGGRPANLSHPIIYVVSDESEHKELAAMLVALASQHVPNTKHAVSSGHTPIKFGQAAMPEFVEDGWALRAGARLLPYATFMPNHAKIGPYNAIVYKGIQGVETGRISPEDGAAFVVEELQAELGDDVIIVGGS